MISNERWKARELLTIPVYFLLDKVEKSDLLCAAIGSPSGLLAVGASSFSMILIDGFAAVGLIVATGVSSFLTCIAGSTEVVVCGVIVSAGFVV